MHLGGVDCESESVSEGASVYEREGVSEGSDNDTI